MDVIIFFLPPFVACLTLVGIHAYLGIHVIEREIIFIDIALAQIAAVGATMAHIFWHAEENSLLVYLFSLGFTILAALFFTEVKKRIKQISQEAVIGVSYAIAAAGALFIFALAAGSDVHMEHMLTGSILWAKWNYILLCAGVYAGVGLFHYIFRDKFLKVTRDYDAAIKQGIRVRLWDFLFYLSVGIVVTLAVSIAGVLVVFALLVIPATISAMYTTKWVNRLWIAYGVSILASIMGLAFSFFLNFSCGPSVVLFLGLALIITGVSRIKLYSSFQGRISRSTYWLKYFLPYVGIFVIFYSTLKILSVIFLFVTIYPSLAVFVKRCHDRNHSGWFLLIGLIPVVGSIWLLVELGFLKGTEGSNNYGQNPLV